MKLRNIQNGAVVKVISEDKVRKTVQVEFEADGKTKDFSLSTIKRWWREIKDDQAEEQYVQEVMEQKKELGIECPPIENYEVEEKKTEVTKKKPGARKHTKTSNPEVPAIVDYIDAVAKKTGMNFYIRDKQPNFKNYRFDEGKVMFTVRIVKHQVEINCKSRDIKTEVVSRMQKMNGFYDLKIDIKTLDDDSKKVVADIITTYKKEDK